MRWSDKVTACGPVETLIEDGTRVRPTKVGGVVSEIDVTVRTVGKNMEASVLVLRATELPTASLRYTDAIQLPLSLNSGMVTVA